MIDPLRSGTVYNVPVKNPLASNGFRISPALGAEHWPRINEKIMSRDPLQRWLRFCRADECACMGCANLWLTWAEYECWRKYDPETNKIRRPGEYWVDPALIPSKEECEIDTAEMVIREEIRLAESQGMAWVRASDIRSALSKKPRVGLVAAEDPPEFKITTICSPIEMIHDAQ